MHNKEHFKLIRIAILKDKEKFIFVNNMHQLNIMTKEIAYTRVLFQKVAKAYEHNLTYL